VGECGVGGEASTSHSTGRSREHHELAQHGVGRGPGKMDLELSNLDI